MLQNILFVKYCLSENASGILGTRLKWRIQEDRKASRKSNTDNNFLSLKCPS